MAAWQDREPCSAAPRRSVPSLAGRTFGRGRSAADFGTHMGVAFQAVDDVLGIWGEPAVTGKPVGQRPRPAQEVGPRCRGAARDRPGRDHRRRPRRRADHLALWCDDPTGGRPGGGSAGGAWRSSRWPSSWRTPTSTPRWRPCAACRSSRALPASWPRSPATSWSVTDDPRARASDRRRPLPRRCSAPSAHLRGLQSPEGWWKGELETNVTMDAEDLLLREFLGIRTAAADRSRSPMDPVAPAGGRHVGDLLRRPAGALDHRRGVRGAAAWRAIRPTRRTCVGPRSTSTTTGASSATRVFTRIWLALFGLWPWERPSRAAAGAHAAPPTGPAQRLRLRLLGAPDRGGPHRGRRLPAPDGHCPSVCRALGGGAAAPLRARVRTWPGRFQLLDRRAAALRAPTPRLATSDCSRAGRAWIVARQEADGSWGGIQPPWVYSLMALHLRGYHARPPGHGGRLAGLDGLRRRGRRTGRRLEACQSPGVGHRAGGHRPGRRRRGAGRLRSMRDAGSWLLSQEVTGAGRLERPPSPPRRRAAGRSSSTTTTIPTSTTRAEVVAGTPRAWTWATGGSGRAGARLDARHAVRRRRVGRLRRRQHPRSLPAAPLLRLRRADRSAERGRDRPRRSRCSPRAGRLGGRMARGVAWLRRCPGARRIVVRPVGGQPRVRDRGGGAGTRRGGHRPVGSGHPAGRSPGWPDIRTPTGDGARTFAPTTTRPGGVAASRPPPRRPGRCWPSWPQAERGDAARAGACAA